MSLEALYQLPFNEIDLAHRLWRSNAREVVNARRERRKKK